MSRKSGHKCLYFNCGKIGRTVSGLKLYRFPKNPKLQQQWVINSGNVDLIHLETADLYKKHICMNHFQDFDFNNDTKKYLKKSAIPIPYQENAFFHVRTPIKTYSSKPLKHNSPSMSTSKQYSPTKSIYIPTPTKINSSRVSEQTSPILTPKTQHLIQNSINMPSPLKFNL